MVVLIVVGSVCILVASIWLLMKPSSGSKRAYKLAISEANAISQTAATKILTGQSSYSGWPTPSKLERRTLENPLWWVLLITGVACTTSGIIGHAETLAQNDAIPARGIATGSWDSLSVGDCLSISFQEDQTSRLEIVSGPNEMPCENSGESEYRVVSKDKNLSSCPGILSTDSENYVYLDNRYCISRWKWTSGDCLPISLDKQLVRGVNLVCASPVSELYPHIARLEGAIQQTDTCPGVVNWELWPQGTTKWCASQIR